MPKQDSLARRDPFYFSLDVWAVAAALTLALLVRIGILKHIPW